MIATIRLRTEQLRAYRALRGWNTDAALAKVMNAHHTTVGRVLRGEVSPGEDFIASLLAIFPELEFGDLFEVISSQPIPAEDVA